jgi:hypothetical protein
MPVILVFSGQEEHPDYVVLGGSQTVIVKVADDEGKPSTEPYVVEAHIRRGWASAPLSPTRIDDASVHYDLRHELLGSRPVARFVAVARRLADPAYEHRTRIWVLAPFMARIVEASRFCLLLAAACTVLLCPQVSRALTTLNAEPSVPLLGAGALTLGILATTVRKWLRDPLVAIGATALASLWIALLWISLRVVVNESLDPMTIDGTKVEVGDFAITWAQTPPSEYCVVSEAKSGQEKGQCVAFVRPDSFWLKLLRWFQLRREDRGCPSINVPSMFKHDWEIAGQCRPTQGLTIATRNPRGLDDTVEWLPKTSVTVKFDWDSNARKLRTPDMSRLWAIKIDENAATLDGVTLVMKGVLPIEEISSEIMPGRLLLAPQAIGSGSLHLGAVAQLNGMAMGHLFGSFSKTPTCYAVKSSERLAVFTVHGTDKEAGNSVSQFKVDAPSFSQAFPFCLPDGDIASRGELQVDAQWTPSSLWQIDLPGRLLPHELSILDAEGKYWGTLKCGSHDPGVRDEEWHVGPVHIDKPNVDLAELRLGPEQGNSPPMWRASRAHAEDDYAWSCWPESKDPPAKLFGKTRSWLQALSKREREYQSGRDLSACSICKNHDKPSHCTPSNEFQGDELVTWFQTFGPAYCDPRRSRLCKCE